MDLCSQTRGCGRQLVCCVALRRRQQPRHVLYWKEQHARAELNSLHRSCRSLQRKCGPGHELAAPLENEKFWQKPYPYGNSFGHLVLHLTGNLNYYIGAQIAQTGYIRDRPREFNDPNPPSKDEALKRFDAAVAMVV